MVHGGRSESPSMWKWERWLPAIHALREYVSLPPFFQTPLNPNLMMRYIGEVRYTKLTCLKDKPKLSIKTFYPFGKIIPSPTRRQTTLCHFQTPIQTFNPFIRNFKNKPLLGTCRRWTTDILAILPCWLEWRSSVVEEMDKTPRRNCSYGWPRVLQVFDCWEPVVKKVITQPNDYLLLDEPSWATYGKYTLRWNATRVLSLELSKSSDLSPAQMGIRGPSRESLSSSSWWRWWNNMAKTCIGLGSSMSLSMYYCLSCGNDETTIPIACYSYADFYRYVASSA